MKIETFELRYFIEVARVENIHRAADRLGISPASVSKAVGRLESELDCRLFERVGRGIVLSSSGRLLLERASRILDLEESTRIELLGDKSAPHIVLAAPEVFQTRYGLDLAEKIGKVFPQARFEFVNVTEEIALKKLKSREVHFAISTLDSPSGFKQKQIEDCQFVTVAGLSHPIFKDHSKRRSFQVSKVLEYGFATPNKPFLGRIGTKQSFDGWRDDKFKRIIKFSCPSSKLIEEAVSRGEALAYLPEYVADVFIKRKQWKMLSINDCPYTCKQKIKILVRDPVELGWINQIF